MFGLFFVAEQTIAAALDSHFIALSSQTLQQEKKRAKLNHAEKPPTSSFIENIFIFHSLVLSSSYCVNTRKKSQTAAEQKRKEKNWLSLSVIATLSNSNDGKFQHSVPIESEIYRRKKKQENVSKCARGHFTSELRGEIAMFIEWNLFIVQHYRHPVEKLFIFSPLAAPPPHSWLLGCFPFPPYSLSLLPPPILDPVFTIELGLSSKIMRIFSIPSACWLNIASRWRWCLRSKRNFRFVFDIEWNMRQFEEWKWNSKSNFPHTSTREAFFYVAIDLPERREKSETRC